MQQASNTPLFPGDSSVPMTQVTLSVSATNLSNKDVMSASDPVCILFIKELGGDQFYEHGRTEQIKDTLNPQWVKKFELDYRFEERQVLRFEIYDWDTKSSKISQQDHLGTIECSLGEIMSYQGSQYKKPISMGGTILICGEEVSSCKEVAIMNFSGKGLDKKDFLGKSDPFLVFYRITDSNVGIVAHKTEVIKNTLNPTWKPMSIPVKDLCSGDENKPIKIECYDWDSDGSHELIGECATNLKTLKEGSGSQNNYPLINPKKKAKKKSYKDSGTLILNNISVHIEPSFLDYIRGGCQLHFTVAVDFTASNGQPNEPNSLHFMQQGIDNQYSIAIKAVGEIIQDYDSDKMFPALGFGARIPPEFIVSHEFFLNGRTDNPYCQGIDAVLQAYHHSINSVRLYGPTNFAPVIRHVMQFAKAVQDGNNYFILLIITDGIITDMEETKRAIIEASNLPFSLIIVGVGDADFSAMELLDADDKKLSSGGVYALKDIVQFVELRRHLQHLRKSKVLLARDVLAEIPQQFLYWMKLRHFGPKPPSVAGPSNTHGLT